MRRSIAIILVLAFAFQFFLRIGVLGYYCMNRQYIAEVLCINKDKPEMKCDGKCYLVKKMSVSKEESKAPPVTNESRYDPAEFTLLHSFQCFSFHFNAARPGGCGTEHAYAFNPLHSVFHPPRLIA